jgi:hypothetical protein
MARAAELVANEAGGTCAARNSVDLMQINTFSVNQAAP